MTFQDHLKIIFVRFVEGVGVIVSAMFSILKSVSAKKPVDILLALTNWLVVLGIIWAAGDFVHSQVGDQPSGSYCEHIKQRLNSVNALPRSHYEEIYERENCGILYIILESILKFIALGFVSFLVTMAPGLASRVRKNFPAWEKHVDILLTRKKKQK